MPAQFNSIRVRAWVLWILRCAGRAAGERAASQVLPIDCLRQLGMAARKVSPGEDTKDLEAEETKAPPLHDQETNRTLAKTPDEDTIRATLHRLATREPHSFHQTTIYYGLERQDTPPRRKYGLLAASIGIVFLQCFVASGLSVGVSMSTCRDNQDCGEGTYCEIGICETCERQWSHCCHTNNTEMCYWDDKGSQGEKSRQAMCDNCVTDRGFESFGDVAEDRIDSMMLQDWVTLCLASIVVAFAVFAEMRDCLLCEKSLRDIAKRAEVPRGWRFAMNGLNFARYYIMLPNIISSVVQLVLNDGGRVKEVCLNTVAVLFLLEVDNMAYLHGLGERTRMEAEEHAGLRITDDELQTINAVKIVCVLAIPGVILAGLLLGPHAWAKYPEFLCELIVPVPSMVVVFVQRVKASRHKLKGACGALGWGLAGWLVYFIWYTLMASLIYAMAQQGTVISDD